MIKLYLNVYGMKCGMCEAHINNEVRKNFKIKKIKSSHRKNLVLISLENSYEINNIVVKIKSLGYDVEISKLEEK